MDKEEEGYYKAIVLTENDKWQLTPIAPARHAITGDNLSRAITDASDYSDFEDDSEYI